MPVCTYIHIFCESVCEFVQVYVCVGLPHKCCSCAFSRIHCTLIQSNMHLVQLLIHSCLHLRFDRFLSLWIAFLFAFLASFPLISFFFHFAHQSAFPLCNFWLTGNSYKRYKRPHQVGIPTPSVCPFSHPFEFLFDHNCKEEGSFSMLVLKSQNVDLSRDSTGKQIEIHWSLRGLTFYINFLFHLLNCHGILCKRNSNSNRARVEARKKWSKRNIVLNIKIPLRLSNCPHF